MEKLPYLIGFLGVILVMSGLFLYSPFFASALNINEYKDKISDSGPSERSNHTIEFVLATDISAGSVIEITPPSGFEVLATTTFGLRNFELLVNGSNRPSAASASPGVDQVEITAGSPGLLRYTLAPDYSISAGSRLQFKIGNHTSGALDPVVTYSSTTGTSTTQADIEPIVNSSITGVHKVGLKIYDGGLVANADFTVFLNQKVNIPGVDTTETVPPYRFNGTPTSTVGGTTLSVEISLETDELAICRFSTLPGISYSSMPQAFTNTGMIFHSTVVAITPASLNQFYVRCRDDEGNYNTDDFIIAFVVNAVPTGTANTEGDVSGNGTGSGNSGAGTGSGSGGSSGSSSGEEPLVGGSSGTGGSGGGGGGGSGGKTGDTAGGGFESTDAPYRSGDGRVIISGYAYPNSKVTILVDGNLFDTVSSNGTGEYSITLDEIARGVYTFGVYAEGPDKVRSTTFSTSFTVTGARTSSLSNINVPPSIKVSPDPVQPGQQLTFSGYTLPNSEVTVENGRLKSKASQTITATSDNSGRWTATADTQGFSVDTYQVRAKSKQATGQTTNFSGYTFYGVGKAASVPINADLNRDGKVNLIDFSILLFWWNTDGGDSNPPADINQDGKVTLTDFSILLFNWSG